MEKIRANIIVSFRAKVLIPVLAVMVLLLAVTVWVVNARITRQVESQAQSMLITADSVFQQLQVMRSKNRLRSFRNLPNEPRYKAALQTLHPETVRDQLATALAEQGVDFVLFTPDREPPGPHEPLIQKRDPLNSPQVFAAACAPAVQFALHEDEKADTIWVGEKLYEVVSVPVYGVGHALIGALTIGEEVGLAVAQEFSRMTHGPILLLAGGRVVASTVAEAEPGVTFGRLFKELSTTANSTAGTADARKVVLGGERYFYSGGRFPSLSGDISLGFLLLSSSEKPFQELHTTQQLLLGVSLVAILFGSAVVWFLVSKVTAPLRELRDSAEAVGQGDYSRRVAVRSQDECGELAMVFNQMTENIKSSREQLEMTVESLKTTQAQLIQSEKLSGIGEFVAGVAHELNNPLTSVMGFSELLAQGDGDPQRKRHLDMIHKSAQRCQKIVQSLLSFARRHPPERKVVCVNRLIEAAVEILHYQLRTSNIEVTTHFDPQLPLAMVDPHQLQQVFLNLINNARQAIEAHQPRGWIKVTTTNCGTTVRVTFQDSGPGIAPENLSKLFDPFFTTKEVGKGTGLGLSLCYGIIKEHGGTITPRSKPGEGATFIIELPITHEAAPAVETPRQPELDVVNPREGIGKKVLVIDDEEPILHMMRDALLCQGYQVDLATNGEAALQHLQHRSYDLALCDWKMPGLNGQQVYERVRASDPKLSDRMIFITGDVINERTQKFLQERNKVCLTKPFSLGEFRTAINQALTVG